MSREPMRLVMRSSTMATSYNSAPELATDFEQWFARKVKGSITQTDGILSPEWKILNLRATLDKSTPAIECVLFRLLPTEIRLKIWRSALPGPRIIYLKYNTKISHVVSAQRPPAILHTCRESREIALKKYKPFFDPQWWCPPGPEPIVYVDPDIDTFYLDCISQQEAFWTDGQFFETFRTELDDLSFAAPVKHLSFNAQNFADFFLDGSIFNCVILFNFQHLETITLAIPTHLVNAAAPLTFLDLIDPALEKKDPTSQRRFRTTGPMDFEIECYLGCISPRRGVVLQELLDGTEMRLETMSQVVGWKAPKVEIKALLRNEKE